MQRSPVDIQRVRRDLADRSESAFYSRIDVVESTGSTNADLIAQATADPAADRVVLLAETQTAGRGRYDRVWVSPPRAQIALSLLLRVPGVDTPALGWLPLLTGIAAADMLTETAQVPATLKWPNDLLLGDRKVAGILAEVVPGNAVRGVVVGIGINVHLTEAELPVPEATSLALAGAAQTERTELVRALLAAFAARFTAWRDSGWSSEALARDYRAYSATIGARVRADLPGGQRLTGTATDIDAAGRLLIDGTAVAAGDVTHLRSIPTAEG